MTEISDGRVSMNPSFMLPPHVKFRPRTPRSKACLGYTGQQPHAYYIEIESAKEITPALVQEFVNACKGKAPRLCRDYVIRCACSGCNACKCGNKTYLACCR